MNFITTAVKDVLSKNLIEQVKAHPVIYDKTVSGYRYKMARDKAWKEVQMAVMPGYKDKSDSERNAASILLINKWNNLRDVYAKYYKAKQTKKYVKPYVFENDMKFLDIFLKTSVHREETHQETNEGIDEDSEQNEVEKEEKWHLRTSDLIKAVKNHPILWDTGVKSNKCRVSRKRAWAEVSSALVIGYNNMKPGRKHAADIMVQRKWQEIRYNYLKYKRGMSTSKPYIHTSDIKFLDRVLLKNDQNDEGDSEMIDFDNDMPSGSKQLTDSEDKLFPITIETYWPIASKDLIEAIKLRPILWNSSSADYNKRKCRYRAWEEVYKSIVPEYCEMDISERKASGMMVKKKWNDLRYSYIKAMKKPNKADTKSYLYKEEMQFFGAAIEYNTKDNNSLQDSDSDNDASIQSLGTSKVSLNVKKDVKKEVPILNANQLYLEIDATVDAGEDVILIDDETPQTPCYQWHIKPLMLIRALRNYPLIWDKKDSEYSDGYLRSIAWKEINNMVVPGYSDMDDSQQQAIAIMIKRRWNNLRDSYLKNLKKKLYNPSAKPYIFESDINYLQKVFDDAREEAEVNNLDKNEENTELITSSIHEVNEPICTENEIFVEVYSTKSEIESNETNTLLIENTMSVVESEDNIAAFTNVIEEEEVDDAEFLKSLNPAVQSLSEQSKLEFRTEVMNLINRLQERDEQIELPSCIVKFEVDSDYVINNSNR